MNRPNEGRVVITSPTTILTDKGPIEVVAHGVRRYVEVDGELMGYIDFREQGQGLVQVRPTELGSA